MAMLERRAQYAELLQESDGREMLFSACLQLPVNSSPWMTIKLALMTSRALRNRMTTPQGVLMLQSPLPLTLPMTSTLRYSKGYASQRPIASSMVTLVVAQDVPTSSLERQIQKKQTMRSVELVRIDALNERKMRSGSESRPNIDETAPSLSSPSLPQ